MLVRTPAIRDHVHIRQGTSDEHTWADTFTAQYHVPPRTFVPNTVLDLGANIGLTARHYSHLWPAAMVWMVEPDEENGNLARQNAKRSPLLRVGVTAFGGWRRLRTAGLEPEAYTLAPTNDEREDDREVMCLGFQQLLTMIGGADFVKMDVEGAEWEILGEPFHRVPFEPRLAPRILVEFHEVPGTSRVVRAGMERLRAYGYQVQPHPPHPNAVWAELR